METQRANAKTEKRNGRPNMLAYFKNLEKQGVTLERVAVDLDRSYSTIANWKYGRSKPDAVVLMALEHRYGLKVA